MTRDTSFLLSQRLAVTVVFPEDSLGGNGHQWTEHVSGGVWKNIYIGVLHTHTVAPQSQTDDDS